MNVAICGRRKEATESAAANIRRVAENALPIVCDVTQADSVKRTIEDVTTTFGPLKFAFNNAGADQAAAPCDVASESDYQAIFLSLMSVVPRNVAILEIPLKF